MNCKIFTTVFLFCIISSDSAVKASSVVNESTGLKKTTKVLGHDQNLLNSESTKAVLSHDPLASLPTSFTICSTIMAPSIFQNDVFEFFSLLGKDGNILDGNILMQVIMTKEGIYTTYAYKRRWKELESDGKEFNAFSNRWIKRCGTYNRNTGLYQVVADGVFVENGTWPGFMLANIPTDLTGKIVLGAHSLNGLWYPTKNKVTNLNIFSTAHSVEVMRQNTGGGKCIEDGDYLAWKDMEWTLHGQAVIETIDAEEPCLGEPVVDVFPAWMDQNSCLQLCENLGSRAPSIITIADWLALKRFFQRYEVLFFWVAIDDKEKEDEWRDHYTHQVMNHSQAFYPWTPNQGRNENCASLSKDTSFGLGLDDVKCESQLGCMCENRPQSYLKLRGLCKDSAIDAFYQPTNNLTDTMFEFKLIGLHTTIEFDQMNGLWTISGAYRPGLTAVERNVTGLSKTSLESFTLGRHNWTIRGDKGCNEDLNSDSYTTELKMSGCKEDQFTCNDGQCVSMDQRCDQLPHCRDKSDERGCDILVLEQGYNKNIPPITSDNGLKKPVDVNTSIDIFKLVDINEEDYSIEIQFQITLEWKENRATYQNLKTNDSLNALTQKDIEELWLPEVIYENTDQKDTTRLGVAWEWKTNVVVCREGNFTRSGLETVDETNIFQGDKNSLNMSQTYTHEFQCQYDFRWYPFDTQVKS